MTSPTGSQARRGLDAYRASGSLLHVPGLLVQLAEALLEAGEPRESERALLDAEAMVSACTVGWCVAELHRVLAALLIARGEAMEAEARLCSALRLAREQSARSLDLRVATDIASMWRRPNRRLEARALLAAVYGCFAEGHNTPDLNAARTVLSGLMLSFTSGSPLPAIVPKAFLGTYACWWRDAAEITGDEHRLKVTEIRLWLIRQNDPVSDLRIRVVEHFFCTAAPRDEGDRWPESAAQT